MVHDVDVVVHECPAPSETVKLLIGLPPLEEGASHATVTDPFPGDAVTLVGAPGAVAGIATAEAVDAELVPAAFVAVTVKV